MCDIKKCRYLIEDRLAAAKNHIGYPMIEERYWIPLSTELSKDIDKTISFLKTLSAEEFMYSLDVLDEVTQNTKSSKLIDAVREIGAQKNCDMNDVESRIEDAKCWLD